MRQAYLKTRRKDEAAAQEDDAEEMVARAIIDLAMRIGETAMLSGATAAQSARLVGRVTRAFHLPAHVDATYTRIVVSYQPSFAGDPITAMRVVPAGMIDYHRLGELESLVESVQAGHLEVGEARVRLSEVRGRASQYRTWVMVLASGVMGGAFAAILGGSVGDQMVAALATALVDLVRRPLMKFGTTPFFAQVVGAAVPTAIALGLMSARSHWPNTVWESMTPGIIVAAGMASMLAGVGLMAAASEAIEGYYLTANARTFEVFTMTGAIVLGLLVTLWLGLRVGVQGYLTPVAGFTTALTHQLFAAGVIALAFGVGCHMGPRASVVAFWLGVLLWGGYSAARTLTDSHPAASGVAAVLIGLVSQLTGRKLAIPVVAMVTIGVSPLMPSLLLYRGVFTAVTGLGPDPAGTLLLRCAMTALALAVGTSFGTAVALALQRFGRLRRMRLRHRAVATGTSA